MKHSTGKIIISLITVTIIVAGYYGIPWGYEKYQTMIAQQNNRATEATGTILSGGMQQEISPETITKETGKLTKETRALLYEYQKNKDPKYLFDLVSRLTEDGAYHTAISLYQILLKTYPDKADYKQYLRLLLNRGKYDLAFLGEYQQTINSLQGSGIITNQDAIFFTSFRTLISGDVDGFYQTVYQLTGEYAPIGADLVGNFKTYSEYKKAPQQYLWGLFASTLLRYGYYAPAIHLAQQSLKFNSDYVLGLQIMAYAHLMTHDRATAKEYLNKLMIQDESHMLTYQRLYGIASYWTEDYKDTVRYLSQVQEKIPNIELLRYIGLSYRSLYDYVHVAKTYREILNTSQHDAIDYFEFFDTYRRAVSYHTGQIMTGTINPIDQYDASLLGDYIADCLASTSEDETHICTYGSALQQLFAGNIDESLATMVQMAKAHPYDFVYGIIGDIYLIKDQIPTAQIYYKNAISSSYNGGYQRYLSNKLQQLAGDVTTP